MDLDKFIKECEERVLRLSLEVDKGNVNIQI